MCAGFDLDRKYSTSNLDAQELLKIITYILIVYYLNRKNTRQLQTFRYPFVCKFVYTRKRRVSNEILLPRSG